MANCIKQIYFIKAQLLLGFFVLIIGCDRHRQMVQFSGQTMGTTYSIKIIPKTNHVDNETLEKGIDSVLVELNKQMSTWDLNSEISLFNFHESMDPFSVSKSFSTVVQSALDISKKTDGFFDVTVYDLMRLWGFGPNPKTGMPNSDDIKSILKYTGSDKISIKNESLLKKNPKTKLDLNAIAKGYGVDTVFYYLRSKGFDELFVEIGGEVRCLGKNQRNKYWSIGVENPTGEHKQDRQFAAIVYTDGGAVATSGNYRNFVDINGEILGHTINPKTGFPVQTNILSVTVQTESCMIADAWATALMAMDYETGLKKVAKNPEIKAVWILEGKDGTLRIARSNGAKIEDSIYEIIR